MQTKYILKADDIKEAVASWLRSGRSVRLDWQDVELEVYRDKDDRSGIESIRLTATATVDEDA